MNRCRRWQRPYPGQPRPVLHPAVTQLAALPSAALPPASFVRHRPAARIPPRAAEEGPVPSQWHHLPRHRCRGVPRGHRRLRVLPDEPQRPWREPAGPVFDTLTHSKSVALLEAERQQLIDMNAAASTLSDAAKPSKVSPAAVMAVGRGGQRGRKQRTTTRPARLGPTRDLSRSSRPRRRTRAPRSRSGTTCCPPLASTSRRSGPACRPLGTRRAAGSTTRRTRAARTASRSRCPATRWRRPVPTGRQTRLPRSSGASNTSRAFTARRAAPGTTR